MKSAFASTLILCAFASLANAEVITVFEEDVAYHIGDQNGMGDFENPDFQNGDDPFWTTTFDLTLPVASDNFVISLDHRWVSLYHSYFDMVYVNNVGLGVLLDSDDLPGDGWFVGQKIAGSTSLLKTTGNELKIRTWGNSITLDDFEFNNVTVSYCAVPEPSTIAMFSIIGLMGGIVTWRRRKKA